MSRWHRFFFFLQFVILTVFIAMICFEKFITPENVLILITLVYFSEFAILEKQRTMNQNAVLYRKSGFFSLLDLLSVTVFILYSWFFLWNYFFSDSVSLFKWPALVLLLYTLFRKIYIYRHYTYEI